MTLAMNIIAALVVFSLGVAITTLALIAYSRSRKVAELCTRVDEHSQYILQAVRMIRAIAKSVGENEAKRKVGDILDKLETDEIHKH